MELMQGIEIVEFEEKQAAEAPRALLHNHLFKLAGTFLRAREETSKLSRKERRLIAKISARNLARKVRLGITDDMDLLSDLEGGLLE